MRNEIKGLLPLFFGCGRVVADDGDDEGNDYDQDDDDVDDDGGGGGCKDESICFILFFGKC